MQKKCKYCGKEFDATKSKRLYCSDKCKKSFWKKKGTPCYYSYTAPFIDESGDVCYYRFDHDEGCWEEDVIYTICQSEEYQESMIFKM